MTDPRLTLESIVAKAITIADAEGLTGVSMRKIAEALGVGAMSLYRHVADKDALLVEMTAEVTRRFAYPADMMGDPDWRARVRVAVEYDFNLYSTHPWVLLAYAVPRNGMQPDTLVCFDWLLEAFGHLGVPVPEAAELAFQVWSYSQGVGLGAVGGQLVSPGARTDFSGLSELIGGNVELPESPRLAALVGVGDLPQVTNPREVIVKGVEILCDGIARRYGSL
ncbi:Tetracycline repressor protein class E [Mycobacteroides salmoniphilum]|uniref:Tetracycline repressor protein class E n=1 Tax=Mycobacteroides salmoniphilum TaxID=404941 RepID=A0A4R8S8B1_9MYCO|nr:TetR/AcrR family transcriptional regulator [Mycobacteroides salmoniphilum]TDZ76909.1 Tetracycline repressor protein class E [Mycobacteroides salmoniphilum]TDZ85858.1 Tetracycline repressor protein class E [Mycobacteroides salmoniphilum]TDZ86612.1 Tetracycline repressor protein class E [Mycobacteroides salmoniphilum]TDZ90052.1 Tetracycline repressor protein class E [Mycobacteroides salmoniphilum]TEA00018.1 Tetracycline repressor protein class E [Mycobacteroides salmoniphilum]